MKTQVLHWYKIEIWYGPGSQGTHIRYFFLKEEADKEWLQEILHNEVDDLNSYDCHGKQEITKVDGPPDGLVDEMIKKAENAIEYQQGRIDALRNS